MMPTQNGKCAKLQEFSEKVQDGEYPTDLPGEDAAYEVRLRNTVQYLQDQLKREEEYLQEVVLRIQFRKELFANIDNFVQATAEILHLLTRSTL